MPSINNFSIHESLANYTDMVSSVNSGSELAKLDAKDSILRATNHTEQSLVKSDESPNKLSGDKTILSDKKTSEKNKSSLPLKEKNDVTSNSISNDKKAVGHIATLSLASLIGIVLAPFTGGVSLLPTAFVVLFGNTSALAMYGGSKFFLDETKENKADKDKSSDQVNEPETQTINGNASPHIHEVQYPTPDNEDTEHSEELDKEIPESAGKKSDRIAQDLIDREIDRENDSDNDSDNEDNKPPASLEDVIQKFGNISVIESHEPEEEIEQFDFISKFSQLPESEKITDFLEQQPVVEQVAHLDNGMQVYIGRIVPQHVEVAKDNDSGLMPPVSLKPTSQTMSALVQAKQWPKVEIPPAVKTTQGATSGRGDKGATQQWPKVEIPPAVKTTQGATSGRGDNHTEGVRHNNDGSQPGAPAQSAMPEVKGATQQWPKVEIPPAVKTTQGATSGRGDNHTEGVRHNNDGSQPGAPAQNAMPEVKGATQQWPKVEIPPAVKTTQGATSGRGDNHTEGVRHNNDGSQPGAPAQNAMPEVKGATQQWPKVEIPPAVKTTQGATSGRGDNHTEGVRHNNDGSQPGAPAQNAMPEVKGATQQWPKVEIPPAVKTTQGATSGRGDNYNSGVRKNINASNPDLTNQVTGQATATESSNQYTKGVKHQLLDIDEFKKMALSHKDNLGIDKETNLHFLHRSGDKTNVVAVENIDMDKLIYSDP